MKKHISLTTALAALLPLAAFAQSPAPTATQSPGNPSMPNAVAPPAPPLPPMPPLPPLPPMAPGRHLHEHDNRPKEPVTFLGVETSQVPRVLSEQLNLPRGFGVVVDYVVPKSPAADAGLQRSDIIRLLNDQIIVSPEQLGVLVRSFADGTTVTLTILRKGQEMKLPVKLVKHASGTASSGSDGDSDWDFDWDNSGKMNFDFQMPDMTAVKDAVSAAVEQARDEARRAGDEARKAGEEARRAARQHLRIVTRDNGTTKTTKVDLGNATVTFSDDKGELKLESHDGNKVLTAKDAQGKLLFQGPVNTDQERAKIPAEVRARFDKLQHEDMPEVPTAPEPPTPREETDSVRVDSPAAKQATVCANRRTGWVRSTILL